MECKDIQKLLSIIEAVARKEYERDNWRGILDSVAQLFKADIVAIGEIKGEYLYYNKVSSFLAEWDGYDPESFRVPIHRSAFAKAVGKGYFIVNDYQNYEMAVEHWKRVGLKSLMVAVLGDGSPIGSLAVGRNRYGAPFTESDAKILRSLAFIFSFIVKEEIEKKNLLERATRDYLTGLYNRFFLEETLSREVSRANRHNFHLSLIMFDLDNFKTVNDRFGHHVGDEVLIKFAEILRKNIRVHDIPARYGGEEFIVLLSHTGPEEAQKVAERIRSAFEKTTFRCEGEIFRLTVSAGIASCHSSECNARDLLLMADKALYSAKRGGKNRVEVFSHAT